MSRPPFNQNISFEDDHRGQRSGGGYGGNALAPPPKDPKSPGGYESQLPTLGYEEAGYPGFSATGSSDMRRKKSMVRPERERIEPGHRLYHYREHAADDAVRVHPSATGNRPYAPRQDGATSLRRGKSVLGRDTDENANESGLNLFKRGATIRRKASRAAPRPSQASATQPPPPKPRGCCSGIAPGPIDAWMIYCFVVTCWIPNFIIAKVFRKKTPEAQRAWREKMGIVAICAVLMAIVGFVTFGFTQTVCGVQETRIQGGHVTNGSVIVDGRVYELDGFNHPAVDGSTLFNGSVNPLYSDQWAVGGMDLSFMFQLNVNKNCHGLITAGPQFPSAYASDNGTNLSWYFPCTPHSQNTSQGINSTGYDSPTWCHLSEAARDPKTGIFKYRSGTVFYSWEQVRNLDRLLVVYRGSVLDLGLLTWLDRQYVNYPTFFDEIKSGNDTLNHRDVTKLMNTAGWDNYGQCLADIIRIGLVDSKTIGCVASEIVLYLSLVFILGAVIIKFVMALFFGWFLSWRMGNFQNESYKDRMKRSEEIENWTDDIYKAAPGHLRPNARDNLRPPKKGHFLPTQSRFSKAETMMVNNSRGNTMYGQQALDVPRRTESAVYSGALRARDTPPGSPMLRGSHSSTSLAFGSESVYGNNGGCPWPLTNVIPQPGPEFEPFGYPLVHTLCLVTAYSESIEGLRTTLDSIATTDYPNSHKLILVVCDGMVRGSGSKQYTPDIVLSMMKDLVVPEQEVEAHSYVAIADGHKRHNMAKVFAGFYAYDNDTVEPSKQQRIPMVLVAKTGNPLERNEAKPGNRGKRDSQIIIMSFLQKVMFDERMTTFEYEFFNSIWRCAGVTADKYETILCVDADTKVFPDSLSRMNACMVNDVEIMGLCGETKIANKRETWVTMIQVFEYYISHHSTKAFESVFGGVTCLPGCFSMYRIKSPKGASGYWVPILANPDIVEHYSENIVDTLHKKNLLLLGEDRYLSTLMLKTFPKRKMVFCPQAVCKTIVPDTFKVLLSQRRRWINSTIHNLFELMLVRDLCGTFCFSMQFVVFMDLIGTLVLPAAITFTLYVLMITIIPSSVTNMPKPIISLILLAFILGLPGVLIVVTSRKWVYVGWMGVYLMSLPIWNFILPAYSFWHMDDFSWGETRKVEGEGKKEESGHGDKEGVFDSSNIVMKRWIEFERERRWREGTSSRDSYYDVIHRSNSPGNSRAQHRHSLVSTSETYNSGPSGATHLMAPGEPDHPHSYLGPGGRGVGEVSMGSTESGYSGPRRSPAASTGYGYGEEEQPMLHQVPSASSAYQAEYDDPYGTPARPQAYPQQRVPQPPPTARGVSLVDPGVVAPAGAQDPVRRVARQHNRHPSSGRHGVTSPTHSSSHSHSLPPGAAPARH